MSQARILFSTGSLYNFDVAQCFELAAEAGCDGMEVMCDERWSTRNPEYVRQLAETYKLPPLVLHTPMLHLARHLTGWSVPYSEVGAIEGTLQAAEAVGAEAIVVHLPNKISPIIVRTTLRHMLLPNVNPFRKEHKNWLADTLPTRQKQLNIKVAVENLPLHKVLGRNMNIAHWNTVEEWATAAPYLTMDTTHWATHGIDPLEAYQAAKERICHVHLSNYNGREHRLPHRGDVDLGRLLKAMAADGFSGTISLELYPDSLEFHDSAKLRQNLRDSVDFCREHLQ